MYVMQIIYIFTCNVKAFVMQEQARTWEYGSSQESRKQTGLQSGMIFFMKEKGRKHD